MAFLRSLVLLCLCCYTSDVVELEPVQAQGKYDCDKVSPLNAAECTQNPYCYWSTTTGTCIDDPCLQIVDASVTACDPAPSGLQCGTSNGNPAPTSIAVNQDCVGGSGKFCRSQASLATYDYCFWAMLRDGVCPSTVCKQASTTSPVDKKCIANNVELCQSLNSEKDCKNVPKCLWFNDGCVTDPCFAGSENKPCGTWNTGTAKPGGGSDVLHDGDCVIYQPYKADGSVYTFCTYKDGNAKPNLCYFLNENATTTDPTDDGKSYPTYKTGAGARNPTCSGTIPNCDDNPSGLCSTKINDKGGLAGIYCGDKDHGAASILHIPSLLVFLLASVFISKFTL